jgi:tryptophan-rich sensory protein
VNLFDFIPGYETHIYNDNKEPLLLLLIAFVLTFAFTRLYTRVARRRCWGSASSGGVHLHHMVIGVIMMAAAGLLSFTQFNYHEILYNIAAIFFGGGLALTLDEFAMIFHLRDVYWAEEGRTSIDAILIGAAGAGAVLLMASPFTNAGEAKPVEKGAEDWAFDANTVRAPIWFVLMLGFAFAIIVLLKKKPIMAIIGFLVLPVGIVSACRLAKPHSPWAKWFYRPGKGSGRAAERRAHKLERSTYRFTEGRTGRFERWFVDLIGGAPDRPAEEISPTGT